MSPFKVVITDFGDPDLSLETAVLHGSGLDIDFLRLNTRVPEEIIPHVVDADAVMVQWAPINRQVIEVMTRCKIIARYGIGVDMVDLAAATDHGVPVANVPDFCIEEVSTQTIGFMIDLNRQTFALHEHLRAGHWGVPPAIPAPARLSSQTLGIVGVGNIGREVARKATCFGMKLLGFDPYIDPEQLDGLHLQLVSLPELLAASDYVALHCPLADETRGLIGAEQLAAMKPSAFLINMARGPVVVQAALYAALVDHTIAGAALDVFEQEPPKPDEPLLQLPNVIVTPHTASWSSAAGPHLRRAVAQNVADMLNGKRPRSIVNRKGLGL